jgi:hypothetical protein
MEIPNTGGIPGQAFSGLLEPELSPDGRELYVSNVQWTLRATRDERGRPWSDFEQVFQGKSVSLSADGLTAHYINYDDSPKNGLARRQRASPTAAWEPAKDAAMPVPVNPEIRIGYNAFDVARTQTYAIFANCGDTFSLPEVAELRRATSDDPWDGFREVPTVARVKAKSCDLVSATEMICEIIIGTRSDLYRVKREDRP